MNAFAHWFSDEATARLRHAEMNPFTPRTAKYLRREMLIHDAQCYVGRKIGCLIIREIDHIENFEDRRPSIVAMRCDCDCGRKNVLFQLNRLKMSRPSSCGKEHIKVKK